MSKYEWLASILSVVTALALVLSLQLLRSQVAAALEQSVKLQDALEVDAESALDALFVTITNAYLAYPELRPIFDERELQGPAPALQEETRFRAAALAECLCDSMERALMLDERRRFYGAAPLRPWIEDSFLNSTFLRDWLNGRRAWYGEALIGMLERAELALARNPR